MYYFGHRDYCILQKSGTEETEDGDYPILDSNVLVENKHKLSSQPKFKGTFQILKIRNAFSFYPMIFKKKMIFSMT